MLRNRDKLQPDEPFSSYTDLGFTFFFANSTISVYWFVAFDFFLFINHIDKKNIPWFYTYLLLWDENHELASLSSWAKTARDNEQELGLAK